jgi:hypothetical protein
MRRASSAWTLASVRQVVMGEGVRLQLPRLGYAWASLMAWPATKDSAAAA